jgi:hypothetical protein
VTSPERWVGFLYTEHEIWLERRNTGGSSGSFLIFFLVIESLKKHLKEKEI